MPRVRQTPKHRTLKLSGKKLKQAKPLPSSLSLIRQTWQILTGNKKLFFGFALINVVISVIFVQGLNSSFDIVELKRNIEDLFGSDIDRITTSVTLLGFLVGSAGASASEAAAAYQLFSLLVISLAVIWCVRQVLAGEKPKVRDGLYRGMYPLIPFLAVLFVIGIQLVPLLVGNLVYSTVINNELAATFLEKLLWFILFLALGLLSAYMLTSSIFALYISTLPDMAPVRALRSARELVLHRRFAVWLRILALPFVLILASLIIFIPLLIFVTPVAPILFSVVVSVGLVAQHIYMYLLYRSLI